VRYSNTFTYSRFKRTQHLSSGPRLKDAMRQYMTSLSVEAYELQVVKPQASEPLACMLAQAQWGLGSSASSAAACVTPAAGGGAGGAGTASASAVGGVHSGTAAAGSGGSAKKGAGGQVGLPQRVPVCMHMPQRAGAATSVALPRLTSAVCLSNAAQSQLSSGAQEPRTPPRHAAAVAAAAALASTTPGSPRGAVPRSPLAQGRSRPAREAAGDGADEGSDLPQFGQGLIAAAACFLLRQTPDDGSAAAASAAAATGGAAGPAGISTSIPIDPVSPVCWLPAASQSSALPCSRSLH
jgi:hypothetical protein